MRTALVFPPSLCLPNTLYFALPVLAGALKSAGHDVSLVDLNLLAADRFLSDHSAHHFLGLARQEGNRLRASGDAAAAKRWMAGVERIAPSVLAGQECKAILRDPQRFFDQPAFARAFWTVVDSLAFFHQLDPVVSPHRDTFLADIVDNQLREPWTPLLELYETDLVTAALANRPHLVGLSVAFPEQAAEAIRCARKLKQRDPSLHVCLGGPLMTQYAEKWLAEGRIFDWVDSVCVGDGERCVVELADALEGRRGLDQVSNLVWRDRTGAVQRNTVQPSLTPIDHSPLPDFADFDWSLALTPKPIWPLMLSRGCYWGRCTFCSIGWRENYRGASTDHIRRDVIDLVRGHGARWIQLQDSSIPPRLALQLARIVIEEKLDVTWVGGMKPDPCFNDPEYCRTLAQGGCRSLLMGMESANQPILDLMDKGYRIDEFPGMLANLRNAGISAEVLWFVGFPTETREQALHTVEWLNERRASFGLNAFVGEYLLHPDTIVHDRARDFGLQPDGLQNDTVHYTAKAGMQPEELHRLEVMLGPMSNRTLVCNGSHLPHVAEGGLDLSGLERPTTLPHEVVSFCTRYDCEADASPADVCADGQQAYFSADFGFRARLEDIFEDVRREWRALAPTMQIRWDEEGAATGYWGVVGLFGAARRVPDNCASAPRTAALLDTVPGIYTAGFSIMGPHSRLPRHCGEDRTLLRCHLGIEIPQPSGLDVGGIVRTWEPGRTMMFDDTLPHHAWNDSNETKVILLVDIRVPERLERGLKASVTQLARDQQYYATVFPQWHGGVNLSWWARIRG